MAATLDSVLEPQTAQPVAAKTSVDPVLEPTKPAKAPKPTPAPTTPPAEKPEKPLDLQGNLSGVGDLERQQMNAPAMNAKPPPEPQQQGMKGDISMWGAIAIGLAALASLRTRQPMMTALNAGAAVMNAMAENRKEEADQAFKRWEAHTRIFYEMQNYELNAYRALMGEKIDMARLGVEQRSEGLRERSEAEKERSDTAKEEAEARREEERQREFDTATGLKTRAEAEKERSDAAKEGIVAGKTTTSGGKETEKQREFDVKEAEKEREFDATLGLRTRTEGEKERHDVVGEEQKTQTEADKKEISEKTLGVKTVALVMKDAVMLDAIQRGEAEGNGLKYAVELADKRKSDMDKLKEYDLKIVKGKELNDALTRLKESPEFLDATPAKKNEMIFEEVAKSGTNAGKFLTNGELDQDSLNKLVGLVKKGQYPFPTPQAMARSRVAKQLGEAVLKDDPNLNTQDYSLLLDARKKLQGKDGDQIRSFTVLVHHLDYFAVLTKALKDAGVNDFGSQTANRIAAKVAGEFGMPQVTDMKFAKSIVGDEMTKAILGSGAGAEADRSEMQSNLDAAATPDQLNEIIKSAKILAEGQLAGQISKYRYFIKKGYLTDDDVVPEGTMKELSKQTDKPTSLLHPGGQDIFDIFDQGDPTKFLDREKPGSVLPIGGTDLELKVPADTTLAPVSGRGGGQPPAGWIGEKQPDGSAGKMMLNGKPIYATKGGWVYEDGSPVK